MANKIYGASKDTWNKVATAVKTVNRLHPTTSTLNRPIYVSSGTTVQEDTYPFQLHYEKTETAYNLYVYHGFVYLGVTTALHAQIIDPLVITASAYIYLKITINADTDNYVLEIKQAPTNEDIEPNSNECFVYHIGYVEWGIVQEATETEPATYGIKTIVQYLKQNLIATGRMW